MPARWMLPSWAPPMTASQPVLGADTRAQGFANEPVRGSQNPSAVMQSGSQHGRLRTQNVLAAQEFSEGWACNVIRHLVCFPAHRQSLAQLSA